MERHTILTTQNKLFDNSLLQDIIKTLERHVIALEALEAMTWSSEQIQKQLYKERSEAKELLEALKKL